MDVTRGVDRQRTEDKQVYVVYRDISRFCVHLDRTVEVLKSAESSNDACSAPIANQICRYTLCPEKELRRRSPLFLKQKNFSWYRPEIYRAMLRVSVGPYVRPSDIGSHGCRSQKRLNTSERKQRRVWHK